MTDAMKKVADEPCQCVRCDDCKGTGNIRYSSNQFDEDDTEPCDMCRGGISEVCSRCELLEDMDHQEQGQP
jgi:hypothetical protein